MSAQSIVTAFNLLVDRINALEKQNAEQKDEIIELERRVTVNTCIALGKHALTRMTDECGRVTSPNVFARTHYGDIEYKNVRGPILNWRGDSKK
jgi:uncharacterized coiled-coil protein SlyX